jgi:hypothetical protein
VPLSADPAALDEAETLCRPRAAEHGGPLRRRLRRHKTFAKGWRARQPFAGMFLWRSPEGRIYLHDRRGRTHDLGCGDVG